MNFFRILFGIFQIYTDELHRLIAEVKARIDDCRALANSKSNMQFGRAEQSSKSGTQSDGTGQSSTDKNNS